MTSYHPISCPCGDVEGLIVLEDAGLAAVEQICVPETRELQEARSLRAASVWVLEVGRQGPTSGGSADVREGGDLGCHRDRLARCYRVTRGAHYLRGCTIFCTPAFAWGGAGNTAREPPSMMTHQGPLLAVLPRH